MEQKVVFEESQAPDVVHEKEDGWYFWDETWSDECGPFETKEVADAALDRYCKTYLGC